MYLAICLYVNQTAYMTIHMFFIYKYTKNYEELHSISKLLIILLTTSVGKFLNNV
jgi:hypothetical protein